jgi:HEAT repeat protein
VFQDLLLLALVRSRNDAADDVLLEALHLGNDAERFRVLDALIQRKSVRGLSGVVAMFEKFAEPLRFRVLRNVRLFHHTLREAGRSQDSSLRIAAMRLIAAGRQGKLTYVISENLHDPAEAISRASAESLLQLAEWVAAETQRLQRGMTEVPASATDSVDHDQTIPAESPAAAYAALVEQRPEIEAAVARALDVHRGKHGADLVRAAMLLVDSPASRAFQILATPKHGGQTPLSRRLQQSPAAEHVGAFLLAASHGNLRPHFANAFAHIDEAPVLDALLRRSHWLKDHKLALCMHLVGRGGWWTEGELQRDIDRRRPEDAAKVGEWIAASAIHDTLQDEKLEKIRVVCEANFPARLRLFRIAARRKHDASVHLLRSFLTDPDERLARMAVREIMRRRPMDFENTLLKLMATATGSVRRIVGRAIGQVGFDHFWSRFDRLEKSTRRQAGRAMLKLLPDAPQRLQRRMVGGPLDQRIKALQIVHELDLAAQLKETILQLCHDTDSRLRSKAVLVAGDIPDVSPEMLMDRLVGDADARVRANAIEVLETKGDPRFVPVLAERARAAASNRERANAIKALFRMRVSTVSQQLFAMLKDGRAEHRISAMWALRQVGWWQLLGEVGRLAKEDENIRVRRYALTMLKGVAELAAKQQQEKKSA